VHSPALGIFLHVSSTGQIVEAGMVANLVNKAQICGLLMFLKNIIICLIITSVICWCSRSLEHPHLFHSLALILTPACLYFAKSPGFPRSPKEEDTFRVGSVEMN
jgi:hypothetical protein